MAFVAGMMSNLAGQSQGRIQAYKDALANELANKQLQEQQREFNFQQGLDENGQPRQIQLPKELSQVIPNNHGKGTVTPDMLANHYAQVSAYLAMHPDQDPGGYASKQFASLSALIPRGTEQFANAAYTSGAKTDLAQAGAALDQARVQVLTKIQPKEFYAKLHEDRDKYIAQIAGRREIANLDNSSRQYIATLTAGYRMQQMNEQDAFRAALDTYNQQMQNYRQANSWQSSIYGVGNPNATQPDLGALVGAITAALGGKQPPITLNIGTGGGGAAAGGQSGNGKAPAPPPVQDPYNSLSAAEKADVDATVAANRGNANAVAQMQQAMASGQISKAVGTAILIRLQKSAPSSKPQARLDPSRVFPSVGSLLFPGGGSNAANPFRP